MSQQEDKKSKMSELDKVQALVEAMPKHPSGVAGVARAVADAIHSCNHVVKVHGGSVGSGATEAGEDRAKLVDALCALAETVTTSIE